MLNILNNFNAGTGLIILAAMMALPLSGEARYSGTLGKMPIEVFIGDVASDDNQVDAVYMYSKYNTPIALTGLLERQTLALYESDSAAKRTAVMTFPGYSRDTGNLTGTWKNLKNKKILPVNLQLAYRISTEETAGEMPGYEVLQSASLKSIFFRIAVSRKQADESSGRDGTLRVAAVNLYEKTTGKLVQTFDFDGEYMGTSNVSVDDYNFDGTDDFSVFESSFAGPNTASRYFLCNPETGRFFDSGFEGVSLEFDKRSKIVTETNSSQGGRSTQTAVYEIRNNKMVLIDKHCYTYVNNGNQLTEVPCE